ncbi:N-acetylglucosamine-6-phosphate deacetylase [Alteromonas pelagimontana]|uniref:N-acetylgalactosamine-6-phosphate deacetylase n=1 Tax=Alteromonas pelagimontana TaxID=1858656 RepID=A0A6M4MBP9_9ALTE|nr:N-acetylglucosamine-6-phosphate deacetylase [Alteromonas pelagimontana]QJR80449.1 N-acetylglucosamine-6-phosphate deacetylase [Alteromonas pelagimontana]
MMFICKQVLTSEGWKENQLIRIANGQVAGIEDAPNQADVPVYPYRLIPGFIDVQVNGGGGVLFNQQCEAGALRKMMEAHRAFGTTALMPTLITDTTDVMVAAARAIKDARVEGVPGIIGVHFEGPWLSKARKGVHSENFIRLPSDQELAILNDDALGVVMVTLAPESTPVEMIKQLTAAGVHVFLGHSNATSEQVNAALEAGAVGFTHLYNAMSPMQSRAPGMVGVALANNNAYAGLIVDGFHVDAQCCKVAINAKGKERIMLVTDAMAVAGTSLCEVPFFDTKILREGNKLTTPQGTLAGSCLTMIEAVQNTVKWCGVSVEDAIAMASSTPAAMLGVSDQYGSIAVGQQADFMCVDDDLNIRHLWQQGKPIALSKE